MTDQLTIEAPKSARELKAEAKAAKARAKAMRAWYLKKRFWLLGVIALVVAVSVASTGSKSTTTTNTATSGGGSAAPAAKTSSNNSANPPQNDVTVEQCTGPNVLGMPEANGKIVNNSSKRSNYMFHIEFLDGSGTRVASGYVIENDVAPGQTATWQASGDAQTAAPATCRIVDVERFAS